MDTKLFHELENDNISFKALSTNHAEMIHEYASDEEVSRFIGWKLMRTLEETREYVGEMLNRESAGTHLYASVVLKSNGAIIGTVMIFNFDREANHAEIGYVFHKDYWGKGYGTEAVNLLSKFAFESLMLRKLHARVVHVNRGSVHVLENNGFELEGEVKDYYFIEGKYYNQMLFGKFQPW